MVKDTGVARGHHPAAAGMGLDMEGASGGTLAPLARGTGRCDYKSCLRALHELDRERARGTRGDGPHRANFICLVRSGFVSLGDVRVLRPIVSICHVSVPIVTLLFPAPCLCDVPRPEPRHSINWTRAHKAPAHSSADRAPCYSFPCCYWPFRHWRSLLRAYKVPTCAPVSCSGF